MFGDLIAGLLKDVIERVWPDPAQKAQAQLALAQLEQAGRFHQLDTDLAMAQGQMDTNKAEAASGDPFASRWRPFIGWTCGAAFAWNWVGLPIARLACELAGQHITLAPADMSQMMPVLLGMLGLGAMRSFDKVKGTA